MSQEACRNWERAYTGKAVTYFEDPRNPSDLEQMWNYKAVHDHIVNHLSNIKKQKLFK
jgi:hypothetical protein